MPLFLYYLPSFERSLKDLDARQKKIVKHIVKALVVYLGSGCDIHSAKAIASGFFFKQLRKSFYEAGAEGKLRVVLRRDNSDCFAILAGTHDHIKRFLRK